LPQSFHEIRAYPLPLRSTRLSAFCLLQNNEPQCTNTAAHNFCGDLLLLFLLSGLRVALLLATLSGTLLLLTSLLVLLVALVLLAALVWIAHVISFGQSSTPLGNALAR
jgi:hypothetical protein